MIIIEQRVETARADFFASAARGICHGKSGAQDSPPRTTSKCGAPAKTGLSASPKSVKHPCVFWLCGCRPGFCRPSRIQLCRPFGPRFCLSSATTRLRAWLFPAGASRLYCGLRGRSLGLKIRLLSPLQDSIVPALWASILFVVCNHALTRVAIPCRRFAPVLRLARSKLRACQ